MTVKQYVNYLDRLFDNMNIDGLEEELCGLSMRCKYSSSASDIAAYTKLYDHCEELVQMYYMLY